MHINPCESLYDHTALYFVCDYSSLTVQVFVSVQIHKRDVSDNRIMWIHNTFLRYIFFSHSVPLPLFDVATSLTLPITLSHSSLILSGFLIFLF